MYFFREKKLTKFSQKNTLLQEWAEVIQKILLFQRVVRIAQSDKVLVFIREVLGSNPWANHIPSVCRSVTGRDVDSD